MPFYSIPTIAIKSYSEIIKKEREEESKDNIGSWESAKAAGYIKAIEDILGDTIAGLVIIEADAIVENEPGLPQLVISPKPQETSHE